MITAILLVFEPLKTWQKIILKERSLAGTLFIFLLPLMILSLAGEVAGLYYLGRKQEFSEYIKLSRERIAGYALMQFGLTLIVVFLGAFLLKAITETFRSRNNFTKSFNVIAYGLSPWLLVRAFDAFPALSPWVPLGVGMVLSIATLYYGIPRGLELDPVNTFGAYVITSMLLAGICALECFVTVLVLSGKIRIFNPGFFH